MGWSGGTYTRSNGTYTGANVWASDEAVAIGIESVRHDTHDQDLAAGINSCLAKDGSNAATGDLNLGNHKLTAVTSGTARTHAVSVAQLQDGSVQWGGTSSGSANAQTITCTPSPGAYATGQTFRFKSGYTNTASATLNVNTLGAVTIYKEINGLRAALGGSDLIANGIYDVTYDAASGGQFVLHTSKPGVGTFTHGFAPVAGTWTPATEAFHCSKDGQVMHVNFIASGTQGVAVTATYSFSLPTAIATALSGLTVPVHILQGAAYETGMMAIVGSTATVSRHTGTFGTGSVQVMGAFSYFTA